MTVTSFSASRRKISPQVRAAARYGALSVAALFVFVPLVTMVVTALNTSGSAVSDPFGIPHSLSFGNFVKAWNTGDFGRLMVNSVIYCTAIVGGVVVLSTMAGYALSRIRLPGAKLIFSVFLLGMMVPFQAVMMPLYFSLERLHLLNSYYAFILPGIAFGLGFGTFLMRAFFIGLPEEVAEAGRIDGASEWQILIRVMLPMARSGILTLCIFDILGCWNAYLMPLILIQNQNLSPVSTGLVNFVGPYSTDQPMMAAGSTIVCIPVVVCYLLLQKHFVRGVVAGALQ